MEKNNNYVAHAVQFGVILAVLRVLLDVTLKSFDVSAIMYQMSYFLGFILEIIVILIAIKAFRDKYNNGMLSMSEAVKIGLIMMIITSTLLFVSMKFYMPEFAEAKALEVIEQYQPEKYDEMVTAMELAQENPKYLLSFAVSLLWFMFIGLIVSLIGGAIFKKNEDNLY